VTAPARSAPTFSVRRLPGRSALTLGRLTVVVRPRAALVTVLALLLAALAAGVGVSIGDYVVPLTDVVQALLGRGERSAVLVVREFRLPRVLVGLLVGAAFGLAGALTSSVVRNPLATPDVLGVTAGASAAAVAVLVLGLPVPLYLAALVGGVGVALLVGALSWATGFDRPRLVLVGIALTAGSTAVTSYLLVRGDATDAQRAVVWLAGTLNGRGYEHVRPVALALAVLLPLALLLGRSLGTLRLGDDLARGLGTRVDAARIGLVAVAVALAAVATASAGPIAFVALVAPQVAVRVARTAGPPLAASAALGALLVVSADLLARQGLALLNQDSTELPVGAVTAVLGAPVLLALLRRSARGRTS
jgi:iron complex transport system permease protein